MYTSLFIALSLIIVLRQITSKLKEQGRPPEYSSTRLKGKVVVITGATNGIGVHTATAMAKMGAHTILACRDVKKGKRVADEIIRKTNNQKVEVMHLELSSFKDVRTFVEEFKQKKIPLNILINNAGVSAWGKYYTTTDGNELQFQVNHLSPFLLTNLLLDTMKSSQPARIINVSADAHYKATSLDWGNLNGEKSQPGGAHFYAQSKLCNILFTNELHRRIQLEGKALSVNALHPGTLMNTNLFSTSFPVAIKLLVKVLAVLGISKTAEQGAWTTIYAACDGLFLNNGGLYLCGNSWKPASNYAKDRAVAKQLWDVSAKLTGLTK